MVSVDDIMNVFAWLSVEIFSGMQFVTWNINLNTSYESEKLDKKDSLHMTDQKIFF